MAENDDKQSFVHSIPSPIGKRGRPWLFKKPKDLWEKFVMYCDYVDSNPWQVRTASNSLSSAQTRENPLNSMRQEIRVLQRAYTLYGFCAYAGIHCQWADLKKRYINRDKEDEADGKEPQGFSEVFFQIENVICAQQVDGAMINQFNASIVARLNSFPDVHEITGRDGKDFAFPKLSIEDIAEIKKLNGIE